MSERNDVVERPITKSFDFELSKEELGDKAIEVSTTNDELAAVTLEFDRIKSEYKGKIAEKEAKIQEIFKAIKDKKESRTIDCTVRFKYIEGVVEYEKDGKIIESRAMEAHERQLEIQEVQGEAGYGQGSGGNEIQDVIREETNGRTKRSAVDEVRVEEEIA